MCAAVSSGKEHGAASSTKKYKDIPVKGYALALLLLLSGCTNLSDLKQPASSLEFTVSEDLVVFYTSGSGVFETRNARGLLKGTYKAIAEDVDGYYFIPVGGRVVRLAANYAEEFERSRVYPQFSDANITGLWLPKPNSKKPADIFFISGVGTLEDHYQPGRGGLVTYGVSNLIEGSVLFWHDPILPDMSGVLSQINSQ